MSVLRVPDYATTVKITDGEWLIQPGVTVFHAVEAHDVDVAGESLIIHAPTRPIRDRGDALNGAGFSRT